MAARPEVRDPALLMQTGLQTTRRIARALVVDDQPQFLALLHALVGTTEGFDVVGTAHSGERAVEAVRLLEPDVVVMDVRMPGVGGIEAARLIKAERPETCVVLVSTTYVDELPPAADTSSADEIVWKGDLRPTVLEQLWLRHRA